MDFSTINMAALRKLPTYKLPPTYSLQSGRGNGCAEDAPGYPTYFSQSVYTQHGNCPRRGPQNVLVHENVLYVIWHSKDLTLQNHEKGVFKARMGRLWQRLPVQHERVQLWMRAKYRHHHYCYDDHSREEFGRPKTVFTTRLERDDTPLLEAERIREIMSDPNNHQAVRLIREFYPEHQPNLAWIADPGHVELGDWWETEARRPRTEEECKASQVPRFGKVFHKHDFGWCQWCGWHKEHDELAMLAGLPIGTPSWAVADKLEDEGHPKGFRARELVLSLEE